MGDRRAALGSTGWRYPSAGALAALMFLAGMAARATIGPEEAAPPSPGPIGTTAPAPTDPGPRRTVAGLPASFGASRAGAVAAALAYTVTASERLLYLDRPSMEAAVRAMTADAAEEAVVADVLAAAAAARTPLAEGRGTAWWLVAPLAIKVEAYSSERARVAVWLVRVLSREGVVVPQSSWATETVELVREDDDWRLWSTASSPGPTPILDGSDLPASAAGLDAALRGFVPVDRTAGR